MFNVNKILPMTRFEPRTSGIGSNRPYHCPFLYYFIENIFIQLKDALKRSSDGGRVVNVSSLYNKSGEIDVDNLNGEKKFDGEKVRKIKVNCHAKRRYWMLTIF